MAKEKHKGGRPTAYTQELADKICAELAKGRSLRSVCDDDGIPTKECIRKWLAEDKHEGFLAQYARSKEESADHMVEEMLEIADDTTADTNRDRLRVDTRKWIASKLKAKKYGDKTQHEVTHKYEDTSEEELKNRLEKLRGGDK